MDRTSEPEWSGRDAYRVVPGPQMSVGAQHRPQASPGQGSEPSLQHDALRPGSPAKHDSLLRSHSLPCPGTPTAPHCTTAPCPDSRQRTSPDAQQCWPSTLQAWPAAQHVLPHLTRPYAQDDGTQEPQAGRVALPACLTHAMSPKQHVSSQQVLSGGQQVAKVHRMKPTGQSSAKRHRLVHLPPMHFTVRSQHCEPQGVSPYSVWHVGSLELGSRGALQQCPAGHAV